MGTDQGQLARADGERTGPLVGVRVVDLGQLVAGPLAASLFGDLGADVVKIERPGKGDPLRQLGSHKGDTSLWWKVSARNKRTIALDLTDDDDRNTLLELVAVADVVIENFVPGTLDRLGIGYEVLREVNARIILLQVSGFGQYGPYKNQRAFGRTGEAFSGLTQLTGDPDRPPINISAFPLADCVSGLLGAMAVLAALRERDQISGEGQHIDLALYEGLFRLMENLAISYDQLDLLTTRDGTANSYAYPVGTWPAKDGTLVSLTASTTAMAHRFFEAIGRPELVTDARYATNESRVRHRAELDPIVSGWFASRNAEDAIKTLEDHGVATCPMMTMETIFRDPHYEARQNIVEVDDFELGPVRMQGVVPKFSRTPGLVRHAGRPIDHDRKGIIDDWLTH